MPASSLEQQETGETRAPEARRRRTELALMGRASRQRGLRGAYSWRGGGFYRRWGGGCGRGGRGSLPHREAGLRSLYAGEKRGPCLNALLRCLLTLSNPILLRSTTLNKFEPNYYTPYLIRPIFLV